MQHYEDVVLIVQSIVGGQLEQPIWQVQYSSQEHRLLRCSLLMPACLRSSVLSCIDDAPTNHFFPCEQANDDNGMRTFVNEDIDVH